MISEGLLTKIVYAVEGVGGDLEDVKDLVEVWERVHRDWQPRVDALRREAQTVPCRCTDGGQLVKGDRCSRCYGRVGVPR
jgi:hypothetical protein